MPSFASPLAKPLSHGPPIQPRRGASWGDCIADTLDYVSLTVFAVLLLSVTVAFVRRPDRRRLDVALLIGTLAIPVTSVAFELGDLQVAWIQAMVWGAIPAHAFLMVRVVDHVRRIARPARVVFFGFLLVSWGLIASSIQTHGDVVGTSRVWVPAYFVATEGYALVAMVEDLRTSKGVRRVRLRIASAALAIIIVVMMVVLVEAAFPALAPPREVLVNLALPLIGGMLLVAFAPPAALQRAWQNEHTRQFIVASMGQPLEERPDAQAQLLVETSKDLLGADRASLHLVDRAGEWHDFQAGGQIADPPPDLWHSQQLISIRSASLVQAAFMQGMGANYLIAAYDKTGGIEALLLVPMKRPPLFAEEDLATLNMLLCTVCRAWAQYATWQEKQRLRVAVLEAQREAAQEASRLKSEFLASTSHEVRTPLNAVLGMATLLRATRLSSQQADYVRKIEASGQHLLAMLSDILDFSRIEAGRMELEAEPFALRSCIEDAFDIVAPLANEKDLELNYDMEPDVPEGILGDVTRLRQVLVNLVGNAVKFTDAGDIGVHVAATIHDGVVLHFEVHDTGPGIPPEDQQRIFELFEQSGNFLRRLHQGAGLGLTISKGIVEAVGGEISVHSVPGKGSTFRFTWPTRAVPSPDRPPWEDQEGMLANKRVLVVENNPRSLQMLQTHLVSWGMDPDAASTPDQAIERVGDGPPYDVVLIDKNLPTMDGEALAASMEKRLGAKPHVVMLANDPIENGYPRLAKPVKPSELYEVLTAVLVHHHRPTTQPPFDPETALRMPMHILVAEDSATNMMVIQTMLKRLGYSPDVVRDGTEAVQADNRRAYDLILMDLQMPEMDGLEATRRILAHRPDAHIVALTAHAGVEQRDACTDAGMKGYITKPLATPNLTKALEEAWAHASRRGRSRKSRGQQ